MSDRILSNYMLYNAGHHQMLHSLHSDSMRSYILVFYACSLFKLLSKHGEVVVYSITSYTQTFLGWLAAYSSSTNWIMHAGEH